MLWLVVSTSRPDGLLVTLVPRRVTCPTHGGQRAEVLVLLDVLTVIGMVAGALAGLAALTLVVVAIVGCALGAEDPEVPAAVPVSQGERT